jgi:hypothetical protein
MHHAENISAGVLIQAPAVRQATDCMEAFE